MFGRRKGTAAVDASALEGGPAEDGSFSGRVKGISPEALAHLDAFVSSRRGVEAFVEPVTAVTQLTVVLIAVDGEWTRRRVDSERTPAELGRRYGIPVYDVQATGYPARMREWTRRQKSATRG